LGCILVAVCYSTPIVQIVAGDPNAHSLIEGAAPGSQIVLGPGYHRLESVNLKSFQTLTGAKGSVLEGPVVVDGKTNVVVTTMTISSPASTCVEIINNSNNITVQSSAIGTCHGRGIHIANSQRVHIYDNYVHPQFKVSGCCDSGDTIFVESVTNMDVQGNVLAYGESNMEISHSHDIVIKGNFMLNPLGPFPRGQHVQAWDDKLQTNIKVLNNYVLSSTDSKYTLPADQEDAINFGFVDGVEASNNYITGGKSASGCGLIADEAANGVLFNNNTLVLTGQCGIGIACGTHQVATNNRIFNSYLPSGGNTAFYVWNQYKDPCGPVQASGNVLWATKPDGTPSSYWNGGGCDPVTLSNNKVDKDAYDALNPIDRTNPPPKIPPIPFSCVAASPYSNQVGLKCL